MEEKNIIYSDENFTTMAVERLEIALKKEQELSFQGMIYT